MKINFALQSKIGARSVNQDALKCCFNQNNDFCAIICDGIGSISGSEYASNLVVNTFCEEFTKLPKIDDPVSWFKQILNLSLTKLGELAKEKNTPDISTTLAMVIVSNNVYYSFNIGDSRVYQIDENDVKQISYDHNYKNYLINCGKTEEELKAVERKWKALTSYIDSTVPHAAVFDTKTIIIDKPISLLLCTDGLYNSLDNKLIHQFVWDDKSLDINNKTNALVDWCLNKDSSDNISCIMISIN